VAIIPNSNSSVFCLRFSTQKIVHKKDHSQKKALPTSKTLHSLLAMPKANLGTRKNTRTAGFRMITAVVLTLLFCMVAYTFLGPASSPLFSKSTTTPTADPTQTTTPTPSPTTTPTGTASTTQSPSATPSPTTIPTQKPQEGLLWLHTVGTQLFDSNNNQIKLYACNILADSTWSSQAIIRASDITKIKSYGFNAIRIHLEWPFLQPTNGNSVDQTAFTTSKDNLGASIDNIVQWTADNNMYVIFNLHWGGSFQAPSWVPTVTLANGCSTGEDGRAVDLFGDTNLRTGISYIYNYMGSRYATNPNVIYEGINELLTPDNSDAGQPFADFNNQWISAIEAGEGTNSHIKIVEILINQDWEVLFTPPYVNGNHQNVMLATHDYSPMIGWTGSQTQIAVLNYRIANQQANVHSAGYPIINTEFSKSQDQSSFPSFVKTELSAFANNDYQGWAYWCYCADSTLNSAGSAKWNICNPDVQTNILPILQTYMTQSVPSS
jgi:hypothetical protein